jgi:hypothetical protein
MTAQRGHWPVAEIARVYAKGLGIVLLGLTLVWLLAVAVAAVWYGVDKLVGVA